MIHLETNMRPKKKSVIEVSATKVSKEAGQTGRGIEQTFVKSSASLMKKAV